MDIKYEDIINPKKNKRVAELLEKDKTREIPSNDKIKISSSNNFDQKFDENLTNNLKPSGIFIFDYILGDGDGQDTLAAINQRKEVLDYIGKKYTVLSGDLNYKESMGTTVCRKIINL